MNKNSLVFFLIFFVFTGLVTFTRYYDFVHKDNFIIKSDVPCNPEESDCFVADCPPGEVCDLSFYKKIEISASAAPRCVFGGECKDWACEEEKSCRVFSCQESLLEEGEKCLSNQ